MWGWLPSCAVRCHSRTVAPLGSRVTGGGGYLPSLDGIADRHGQEVADAAKRCLGDTEEVAVFNPRTEVTLRD